MRVAPPLARAAADDGTARRDGWPGAAHILLAGVSVAYCLVVFARTSQSMAFTFDEVVYASQVAKDTPPAMFSAPRARGMALLLAPVLTFTDSVFAVRVYLALLSGVMMYLAFRPWLRTFDRIGGRFAFVPAVAAGSFATLWTVQLYGTMAYPNLWLAFVLVGGVGYFCRALSRGPGTSLPVVAVAVALAIASLLRPTDATAAAAPLLGAAIVVARWRQWRPIAAVVGGLAVGWTAWGVEAHLKYGGFVQRLRDGAETNEGGLVFTLPEHFEAVDGPALLCRPHALCAGIEPTAPVWWILLPLLVGLAFLPARSAGWLSTFLLVTASALAVAAPYIFLIDYAAPRFLLPTYGLLMIPAAAALLWLAGLGGRGLLRSLTSVALAVAILLHTGVQQELLDGAHAGLVRTATNHVAMADFLRSEHDVRPPCLLWGEGVIQQSYLLKCDSRFRRGAAPLADDRHIQEALRRGDTVVVRLRSDVQIPAFMADWRRVELPRTDRYVVYLPPDE